MASSGCRIFVVGSVNQDLVVRGMRWPEPGETLSGETIEFFPGGKGANQAVAAQLYSLDAAPPVTFVGRVGDDAFGRSLIDYLESRGLQVAVEVDRQAATGTAVIFVDHAGENRILLVPGANATMPLDVLQQLEQIQPNDLMLVQNEIRFETSCEALRRARQRGARTLWNLAPARPLTRQQLELVDLLIVNETEYATVFGESLGSDPASLVRRRRSHLPCDLLVTLGPQGVLFAATEELFSLPGHPVSVVDTTGAGDCFVGAFVACWARGVSTRAALEFANRAAALSITRPGASVSFPSMAELAAADL